MLEGPFKSLFNIWEDFDSRNCIIQAHTYVISSIYVEISFVKPY